MAIYWHIPGFKGRTFKLCVLIRWDLISASAASNFGVQWGRETSNAIKSSKLHSSECRTQTQTIVYSISQHRTTWRSDKKLERNEVGANIWEFENSLAPYLFQLLQIYQPTQTLWSSNEKLLKVPKTDPKSVRNRSFHYQAAVVWNSLLRAVPTPCHYPRSKQISKLTCLKSTFLLMSSTHPSAV